MTNCEPFIYNVSIGLAKVFIVIDEHALCKKCHFMISPILLRMDK